MAKEENEEQSEDSGGGGGIPWMLIVGAVVLSLAAGAGGAAFLLGNQAPPPAPAPDLEAQAAAAAEMREAEGEGFKERLYSLEPFVVNVTGDGYSRYLVHWEMRESMTETDVEIVLERAKERFPDARPRLISDNGSAFIARDFKTFVRESGMTHVRSSPYYPQSNGKIERFHRTIKADAIRRFEPSDPEQAREVVGRFVDHYNNVRLHSAIGYITPVDMMAGREREIWQSRDQKLEAAREQRRLRRRGSSFTENSDPKAPQSSVKPHSQESLSP